MKKFRGVQWLPVFLFQDNTFSNSLRVCADVVCETIAAGNSSSLFGVDSVYEVGGTLSGVNAFDVVRDNLWALGFLGFVLAVVLAVFFVFFKRK